MRQRRRHRHGFSLESGLIIGDEHDGLGCDHPGSSPSKYIRAAGRAKKSMILITHRYFHRCGGVNKMPLCMREMMGVRGYQSVFHSPCNPYTIGLQNAFPVSGTKKTLSHTRIPPSLMGLIKGCRFYRRCPFHIPHAARGTGHGPDQRISLRRRAIGWEKGRGIQEARGAQGNRDQKKKFLGMTDAGNDLLIQVRNLKNGFPSGRALVQLFSRVKPVCEGGGRGRLGHPPGGNSWTAERAVRKDNHGMTILRLHEPSSGEILYKGEDIARVGNKEFRGFRRHMQIIFQDPINPQPRFTILDTIKEPLDIHRIGKGEERIERCLHSLRDGGADSGENFLHLYPHQLSGSAGTVMIAKHCLEP